MRSSNQGGNHRKPKQLQAPTTVLDKPPLIIPGNTDVDQSREIAAGWFLAHGHTNSEIAGILDLHPDTVSEWRKLPAVQAACAREVQVMVQNVASMFDPLIPKALSVYRHHLELMDKEIARDVMDRRLGKPIVRQQIDQQLSISISLQSAVHSCAPALPVLRSHIIDGQVIEHPQVASGDPLGGGSGQDEDCE